MGQTNLHPIYRGRFAPSPTGPLHFGSLVAALGSLLDARAHQGEWLVRMEDLDRTREVKGAADDILRTLERFGFEWESSVLFQSRRTEAYAEALSRLLADGLAYPCGCSRKGIQQIARHGIEGPIYPGTCRNGLLEKAQTTAIRLRTQTETIQYEDRLFGALEQNLGHEIGDFVIRRADGFHAYQLAVVVDDAEQGVNQVVRGADLLLSTPRQIYLQRLLDLPQPAYAHLPLALDPQGNKLSKRDQADALCWKDPMTLLLRALEHLHQRLPSEHPASLDEFWRWAIANWSVDRIPPVPASQPNSEIE